MHHRYYHPIFKRHYAGLVFYGPPAAGKSTAVREALRLGIPAYDYEGEWPFLLRHPYGADVVGAAGHPVAKLRELYPWHRHTLILPDRPMYDNRRRLRDLANPRKAGQPDVWPGFDRDRRSYDEVHFDPIALVRDLTKHRHG